MVLAFGDDCMFGVAAELTFLAGSQFGSNPVLGFDLGSLGGFALGLCTSQFGDRAAFAVRGFENDILLAQKCAQFAG